MGHTRLVLIGLVIGHFKAMLAVVVIRALDLIPLVTLAGHAIAVLVHAHHDDARLAAATRSSWNSLALNGVAIDFHVIAVLVDHRMVEPEDDVATVAAQTDSGAIGFTAERSLELGIDVGLGIAWLIGGKNIDELSGSGQIVIHMGNVRRVFGACSQRCSHC